MVDSKARHAGQHHITLTTGAAAKSHKGETRHLLVFQAFTVHEGQEQPGPVWRHKLRSLPALLQHKIVLAPSSDRQLLLLNVCWMLRNVFGT